MIQQAGAYKINTISWLIGVNFLAYLTNIRDGEGEKALALHFPFPCGYRGAVRLWGLPGIY